MQCATNKINENYPECPKNFEQNCAKKGGLIRIVPINFGGMNTIYECKRSAADVGKICASDSECSEGCNLKSAIDSGKCTLTKKDLLAGELEKLPEYLQNTYKAEDFYVGTYSCSTNKPGTCKNGTENIENFPGISTSYEMESNNLTETRHSGPIY